MKHYKCSSKTGRECCLWLFYSIFCSSNLHSSVATDEMVHRLGQA
ncbi:hypothetical protein HanXRQr2_Chr05g0237991 [Helianthus annuus]|uniref:Uncharacterized protein n=1 Tax=Helianthus annuus TaxID=4232 RepID=A0A9K3J3K6_HELAN|nr:hypothetical protein HanXRQr2_Chr05g0237991 [Helianthus annuus]